MAISIQLSSAVFHVITYIVTGHGNAAMFPLDGRDLIRQPSAVNVQGWADTWQPCHVIPGWERFSC